MTPKLSVALTGWCLCLALASPASSLQRPPGLGAGAIAEVLAAHNGWRARVGVAPLGWSNGLAEEAGRWATTLVRRGCRLEHSSVDGVGENLLLFGPRRIGGRRLIVPVTPTEAINRWGNESRDYSYERNRCSSGRSCGHYTQIVWRGTEQVGCAWSICGDQSQIWVCQYWPAGNIVGRRPY